MTIHAMAPISGGAYGQQAKPRRVFVVGYDGSVASESALRYASEHAGRSGHVVVVHACGPGRWGFGVGMYEHAGHDYDATGAALLTRMADRMPEGVSFETVLSEAPVAKALVDAAREHKADEVVVGVHGWDPSERGLGGVPLALLAHADLPVVVVPGKASAGDGRCG